MTPAPDMRAARVRRCGRIALLAIVILCALPVGLVIALVNRAEARR